MEVVSEKQAKARAQALRWNRENPDKVRANHARWRAKNYEKVRQYSAKWREHNREKLLQTKKTRDEKISNLLAVLRDEMPELLKEFGL